MVSMFSYASPDQDQAAFRKNYQERFPSLKLTDYSNGVYAIDEIAKQSWAAIEEFPPYEAAIEANQYPLWDKSKGEVITLAKALNDCRISQKVPALAYDKSEMVNLLAYLAFTSRGKPISVTIPQNDPRALAAYEEGKAFYYQRQGQLNFSCATCHIQNAGKRLRSEILSASLGHTNNWPTYRLKWGEMGSLHRRFAECLINIKAQAYPEQSVEFRNLEYFLGYMGNGVPISGPSTRK
jgi:L-cysteine S-thiosulfotransferase